MEAQDWADRIPPVPVCAIATDNTPRTAWLHLESSWEVSVFTRYLVERDWEVVTDSEIDARDRINLFITDSLLMLRSFRGSGCLSPVWVVCNVNDEAFLVAAEQLGATLAITR